MITPNQAQQMQTIEERGGANNEKATAGSTLQNSAEYRKLISDINKVHRSELKRRRETLYRRQLADANRMLLEINAKFVQLQAAPKPLLGRMDEQRQRAQEFVDETRARQARLEAHSKVLGELVIDLGRFD